MSLLLGLFGANGEAWERPRRLLLASYIPAREARTPQG
jgi:hypothetical protein